MLTIEKTVLASPDQMQMVIEGMRNPKNSWDRSDSAIEHIEDPETMQTAPWQFHLGEADHELMRTLAAGGSVHAKYRRMIPVMVTINAPLYWWKEFDTYKVGTVANSCSTMHKIHEKPFNISDFSAEHLITSKEATWGDPVPMSIIEIMIDTLNVYREKYLTALQTEEYTGLPAKDIWWQLIQLLPSSYNQKRTVMLNYEVLSHIYTDRHDHKLDEWHVFCDWIKQLPYADLIIPDNIGMDISEEELMTVNELREKLGLERVEDVSFIGSVKEEHNNE